ncbi:unnamed protein product [Aphanomyces euteiches]|nr:hypothetical protein Ae201684_004975 [Aphanomyces euteiches]KAH9082515.1 hypothetical protein Ae201684P_009838 [Aphanomyces euteiches]
MSFYAVAVGRKTGVFRSWDNGAKEQVSGYPSAKFKKFKTNEEAESFIRQNSLKRGREENYDANQPPTIKKRLNAVVMPPTPESYYLVLSGHSTGVFDSWSNVEGAILEFPNAMFRKFSSKAEAENHWRQHQASTDSAASSIPGATSAPPSSYEPLITKPTQKESCKQVKFYAVAKGRDGKSGIFTNWKEAEALVKDFYSAKFKSFLSLSEAEEFMAAHKSLVGAQPGDPDPQNSSTLVAFCDGSAIGNGKARCSAAFACVFPHNEAWNVSGKLPQFQATNNRAEYLAALEALKRANLEDPNIERPLYIFSDSMLLIRSMTEWLPTWQKNNWIKSDGEA